MNFQDLLEKIKRIDEATGEDLGDGFQKVTIDFAGRQVPAVLDTQTNTTVTLNKDPATGTAIVRSMAPYIIMQNGQTTTTMKIGPATTAAMQKAGMISAQSSAPGSAPAPTSPTPANESLTDECGDTPMPDKSSDDMLTGECGGMMSPMSAAPKQSDSVTMNVSMNGSGAGGIKDLIDILRNIDSGSNKDTDDVLVGIGADEEFDNSPKPQTAGVNAVTPTGDDIHSKGLMGRKGVGISGSNAMESLVSRLSERYQAIKGN